MTENRRLLFQAGNASLHLKGQAAKYMLRVADGTEGAGESEFELKVKAVFSYKASISTSSSLSSYKFLRG